MRFSAPPRLVEQFYREHKRNLAAAFLLYGSGDFHYLTALRLRSVTEPIVLVSFDNHPDWDVRPPKWACGGWINRALELPNVPRASVWGCGNFECWWPHQIFGNRRAERAGFLDVHPWAIEEAVTNWESGRFALADLEWALRKLRAASRIVAGDLCGAYSPPHYARGKQRFAAEFDRPKLVQPNLERARQINLAALERLWPLLATPV